MDHTHCSHHHTHNRPAAPPTSPPAAMSHLAILDPFSHLHIYFLLISNCSFFYPSQYLHPNLFIFPVRALCIPLSSLTWIISVVSPYILLSPLLLSSIHLPHCYRELSQKHRNNYMAPCASSHFPNIHCDYPEVSLFRIASFNSLAEKLALT